jgi:SynChlorMet cassette protein ScmC
MKDIPEVVGLSLANGMRLGLMPGDGLAYSFISHLIEIMQLKRIADPTFTVILRIEGQEPYPICKETAFKERGTKSGSILRENSILELFFDEEEKTAICIMNANFNEEPFFIQMRYLSALISSIALNRGCLFIHGGLAEKGGIGVIFAGKSGSGKTTAVNRMPAPWKPLCDESTFIVPDDQGVFWAHPMPTHSRFIEEGQGGIWNVQHSVPLKGIFFLAQDNNEQLVPLNRTNSAYLINQFAYEAMVSLFGWCDIEARKAIFMQILSNSSAVAQEVPAYILRLSLTGPFWNDVDRAIFEKMKEQ